MGTNVWIWKGGNLPGVRAACKRASRAPAHPCPSPRFVVYRVFRREQLCSGPQFCAEVQMLGHPGAAAGSDLKPRQGKIPVADLVRLDVESRGDERYDDICR